MKFMKWKLLCITCAVCLLPVLFGVFLWERLPDTMAVHFDMYNTPDRFASKGFVVFGLPLLMVLLQVFCCFINDINAYKHGERKKLELATKWVIPVMAIVLQSVTLAVGLGQKPDIRAVAMLIVGVVMLVVGNYLPKFESVGRGEADAEKARKINRFIGFETVIMGLLGIASIFLPPVFSIAWLILLVPYALLGALYGIRLGRK